MKVSIIIAAYNIQEYINRCLDSIVNQTLKDIEIIVVNDGSTDCTKNIIENYLREDDRIILVNQDNKGLIEARKSGLKLAKGEYILFIDGDDWLELDSLEILYKQSINLNTDITLYNYKSVNDKEVLSKSESYEKDNIYEIENDPIRSLFLNQIEPSIWSKFIKRNYIIENNIEFPSNISFAEDIATVSSLLMNNPKIGFVDNYLYNYYQRTSSITKVVNHRVLEVDRAIEFIRYKLIDSNLYEKYKQEFEHFIFWHLFLYRQATYRNKFIHHQVFKQYKQRNIEIKNNTYIKEYLKENKLDNMLINFYNINYYFGRFMYLPYRMMSKLNKSVNE